MDESPRISVGCVKGKENVGESLGGREEEGVWREGIEMERGGEGGE